MKKIIFILLMFPSLVFGQATGKIIADRPSGGTIPLDTINAATLLNLGQTTAGQTITVPSLLSGAKTLQIRNTGSASVTLSPGGALTIGKMLFYAWTGSAWSVSAGSSGTGTDTSAVHKTGNEIIRSGVKTFIVSPSVPTPSTGSDATNKSYVDTKAAAKQDTGVALLKDGSVALTGDLTVPNNGKIINTAGNSYLEFGASGVLAITGTPRLSNLSPNTVPYLNESNDIVSSSVTPTELGYVHSVTSPIQTQLNAISGNGDSTLTLKKANNLADLANKSTARINLGVAIGTNVQAFSSNLSKWSLLDTVFATSTRNGRLSYTDWNTFNNKASSASVAAKRDSALASGKIVIGQTYGGGLAVTPSGDVKFSNAGITSTMLDTLGPLFSISGTTWNGNSGSFTKTGAAATFTHGSSKLSVSGGIGTLLQFYSYDTYGSTNLDEIDINGRVKITALGTGIAFGLESVGTYFQIDRQFLIDCKAASSGRLTVCADNDTTPVIASINKLAMIVGDSCDFNIKLIKGKVIFSIKVLSGTNIGKSNMVVSDLGSGKFFNTGKFTIYAVGGSQEVKIFSASSRQKKNTVLFLGNSITSGAGSRNNNNDFVHLIRSVCHGSFATLSGSGNTLSDFSANIPEITSLTPTAIFICASINDIQQTHSAATAFSRTRTLVTSLTSAGYVVGRNLFICPSTPYSLVDSAQVPILHDSVIANYRAGYIDFYTILKTPYGRSLNTDFNDGDGIHENPEGNRLMTSRLISSVPSIFILKNMTEPNAEVTPYLSQPTDNNKRILCARDGLAIGSASSNKFIYSTNATTAANTSIFSAGAKGAEADANIGGFVYVPSGASGVFGARVNSSDKVTQRGGITFGVASNTAGAEDGYVSIQTKTGGNATAETFRFGQTGLFGVGLAATKGYIEIKAGTTSFAPMVFTAGTANTTAQAGAMEYTGTNFTLTPTAGNRRRIPLINNATASNGQIPIGNGTDYTVANITAGINVIVTNGSGTITVDSDTTAGATKLATQGDITRAAAADNLKASATLDFTNTSAQSSSDLTITVTGASLNDPVMVGAPNGSVLSNSSYSAWVSSSNTVTVRFNNYSSGAQDPASGTFKVTVNKN